MLHTTLMIEMHAPALPTILETSTCESSSKNRKKDTHLCTWLLQLLSPDVCHTHTSNKQTSELGAGSLLKELTSGEHALQVSPPATPRVTMVCSE